MPRKKNWKRSLHLKRFPIRKKCGRRNQSHESSKRLPIGVPANGSECDPYVMLSKLQPSQSILTKAVSKRLAVGVPTNGSECDPYVMLSKLQPSQSILTKADFSIKTRGRPRRAVQPANNGQIPAYIQAMDQKRKQCHVNRQTIYQRARILSKPSQHSDRTLTRPPSPPKQTFFVYSGGGQSLLPSNTDAVLSSDGNLRNLWQLGRHGRIRYTTCNRLQCPNNVHIPVDPTSLQCPNNVHIPVDPTSLQCPNNVHIPVDPTSLQCPNSVHKDLPTLGDKDAIRSSEPLVSPPAEMSQDSQLCVTADDVLRDSARVCGSPETGRKYKCPLCSKVFTSLSDIRGHVQLHLNGKSFKCGICCKEYYSRKSMVAHRRIHFIPSVSNTKKSSEKSGSFQRFMETYDKMLYKCNVCPREFTNEFSLRNHANDHLHVAANPAAYVCSFCGKQFKLSISLTAHMNSHMRKRQCELSNKKHTLETTVLQAHALGVVEQQTLEIDGLHSHGSSVVEQEISEMDGLHSHPAGVAVQETSEMGGLQDEAPVAVEQQTSEMDWLQDQASGDTEQQKSEMDGLISELNQQILNEQQILENIHLD